MANMSAKFYEEAHNGLVSIPFTSLFPFMSIVTFDLRPPKSMTVYLLFALRAGTYTLKIKFGKIK